LAVLAPAAAAQDPAALLDAAAQVPANPPGAVVSDQYRAIEAVVTEALPAAPAPEPAAPPPAPAAPPPAPEPEYHPEPEQYHSEKPSEVTVTQANPQNVNVSIRINSPGDDGPVTQINNTGSVSAPEPAKPKPAEPPSPAADAPGAPAGPDTWEWIWTSACFGGSPGGGAPVATASARWVWRWSCGEAPLPALADGVGEIAEEVGAVLRPGEHPAWPSMPTGVPGGELVSALAPARGQPRTAPRARPERRGSGEAAGAVAYERPPPGAGSAPAAHGGLLATGASPPATRAAVDAPPPPARHKAQARPLDDAGSHTPSGDGGGLAAGPATGNGGGASLLLAGWLAVLASALGLVLPRLWLRRWSGPAWRIPWPRSTRLERPG
jgi:hypothetical protein